VNLTHTLADALGRDIVSGAHASGKVLSEAAVAGPELASRSAVREAVRLLEGKGLIEARPRRGTTVLPQERWNLYDRDVQTWLRTASAQSKLLNDLLAMRRIVEPEAAALAAASRRDLNIDRLSAAHDRMVAAQNGNGDSLDADIAFHAAILLSSDNSFLFALTPLVETALRQSIRLTNALRGDVVGDLAAHSRVFYAIRDGDADQARTSMRQLLDDVAHALAEVPTTKRNT
jgi:DNA-binding FadR family transcriptional regulator